MKTYIWTLPIRIFHWLLVIALILAYIFGEEDSFLKIHVAFGYFVGVLLVYRIIYGLIGSRYARFRDFPVSFSSLWGFASNMNESKKKHIGHNPFSSVVMLAIFFDALLVVISGILTLTAKGQGFLKNILFLTDAEMYKEMHEAFIAVLISLVVLHIAGLVVDRITNKSAGTIQSMFTGYKDVTGENAKESKFLNIFFIIIMIFSVYVFASTLNSSITGEEENEKYLHEDNEKNDDED
jgi:cytochrome b